MGGNGMSVYVALLEKIEELKAGCFEASRAPVQGGKRWITLGHFDGMRTYELETENKNLFQAIAQNNKKIARLQQDSRYLYPLYMISSEDARHFWEDLHPFFSVVKIHFAESVNSDDSYEQLLEKLPEHSKRYGCIYHAFRTIELSDMILAVSADKLSALLEFALTLRVYSCVGKVYTYACVDYELVKGRVWQPDPEDRVDLFSMRFSVTDFGQAKASIARLEQALKQEQAFSVCGVDDIVVNWRELKADSLLRLYRTWFFAPDPTAEPVGQCFAEITTRVGISLDKVGEVERPGSDFASKQNLLKKNCEALSTRCESIRVQANQQGFAYHWIDSLSALTNTLVRISKTSVLDEFVYIMYNGVDAFLKNVERRVKYYDGVNAAQCQDFVENLAHLMEHIMRIEGQLTHNPQMRPILYDIPVAMLEYVLSFLKQVSEILQTEDASNKKDICFLLVPRLCERIEAQELFPAVPNSLPGLILVIIPLQMLYDSRAIQQELTHEVSHFVGEVYRNRTDRMKKYIQATAALMSRIFFGDLHPALVRAIQGELREEMKDLDEPNIKDMVKKVMEWVRGISEKQDKYVEFVKRVLSKNVGSAPLKLNVANTFITGEKILQFKALLEDLSILFREIYADICMLYLLPISSEEYVASLMKDLLSEKDEKKRRYEQVAIRIYVGLKSARRRIPLNYIQENSEDLGKEIQEIDARIWNQREMKKRLIPITSIWSLFCYAKHCYKQLCREPQLGREEIREMYCNVISPEMDYKKFTLDINSYRVKILS